MTAWLDAILVLFVLTSLWLLGSSRLHACIQAVALQGFLMAAKNRAPAANRKADGVVVMFV